MSIVKIRKPLGPFEVIDKASIESIRDPVALAVWVYLRSKPEGWIVRETDVREHFDLGRDRYRAAVRYLCEAGATVDARIHDKNGHIVGRELIVNFAVSDDWISVHRAPENPSHGASNGAGSDRKPENPAHGASRAPENPSHGVHRAPEKTVTRETPSDGFSAPLVNKDLTQSTEELGNTPQPPEGGRRSCPVPAVSADVAEVIARLNTLSGFAYKPIGQDGKQTAGAKLAQDRIRQHGVESVLAVIERKCAEWPEGNDYHKYLRPGTLFRPSNFDDYVGQINSPLPTTGGNHGQQGTPTNHGPNQRPETHYERNRRVAAELLANSSYGRAAATADERPVYAVPSDLGCKVD
jgi:uncharacterized phage protein (TIGR02220 family)